MPLSHDRFEVNEAWIAFRVNDSFLFIQSEPYDMYVLMDAYSTYVLSFALSKVVDEGPSDDNIAQLLDTAFAVKNEYARKIMMAEGDPAVVAFKRHAKKHGMLFETVSQADLEPLTEEVKVSFAEDFLKRAGLDGSGEDAFKQNEWRLEIGQSVRVLDGTTCPDAEQFDIGGWQGRIFEIEDDGLVGIAWDSVTLADMPQEFVLQSIEEDLDWASIYLGSYEVRPTSARDSEADVRRAMREVEERYYWYKFGPEGRVIESVLKLAGSDYEPDILPVWDEFLRKKLALPFSAFVAEYQAEGDLQEGDEVAVLNIEPFDEDFGTMVACERDGKKSTLPLTDLDTDGENAKYANAYRIWFSESF